MPSQPKPAFNDKPAFHLYKSLAAPIEYVTWRMRGSPDDRMPHLMKQRALRHFGRLFHLQTLVETGMNYAHMIYVQQNHFREIYSIELDPHKVASARRKFAGKPNIHILEGDSASILPQIVPRLAGPALFWLDAHDFDHWTAVNEELEALLRYPGRGHVILIDDAKWFDGRANYPLLDDVCKKVASAFPDYRVDVGDCIIRIAPPKL